ncbi:uncharacterized protein LOC141811108 [Halichoeres trimaculatus]|uniref:uncharacterized protein LOC141811108 n=1 Tax=Halichoeres trimaculatus TaxID=147232 RepID=UPI003D9DBB6A
MSITEVMSICDVKPSKYEILREIFSEKLTTAAREIFAVVERTVSGYEEEAAALRREVERQKEQLEAVLQPRVTLRRIEPARGPRHTGSELPQDKMVQTNWEDSARRAILKHNEEKDVTEPGKKGGGATKLQVCLFKDAHTNTLTRNEFEAVTQKLTPLNLETVTPENMEAAIKSGGDGPSALYVRVKVEESQISPEQPPSSETNHRTKDDAIKDHEGARASFSSVCVERAESRQHQTKPKEEVEQRGISVDFRAPDSAHCAAGDGDDAEDETDDGDEENDKEIESLKPNDTPPKIKKKKRMKKVNSVVKRKRKNLEASTENVLLSCKVCQALSGSRNMLIKHSWSHVEDPERLCGVCGEHSESPEELRSHLNSHKKTYSCDVCGKNFISRIGLQKHAAGPTKEKPHRCDVCCKVFCTTGELVRHQRSHTNGKLTCDVCGKQLPSSDSLKRHLSVHTAERRHECSVCKQTFKRGTHLRRHMKIHSGLKPFVCGVCRKAFLQMKQLAFHMKVHNEERPYKCPLCNLAFKTKAHMETHKKIHSGVKTFVCSVCGTAFFRKDYLKRHMGTHNRDKPQKS